ncbi:MAG TPA: carboxypeptidase-like regulatory domain-containing protein [Mucilaginibacter sp.]
MFKRLLFVSFLFPATCFAQYSITGKLLNATDKTGVPNASVFLNNAVAGSKSGEKGDFTISNVRPGQYDLVVTCVGYETLYQHIVVNADVALGEIKLPAKVMELKEVRIHPKGNWSKKYAMFKQYFFGTSEFSRQCKIVNKNIEDVLDLEYYDGVFKAHTDDFLEIENKALGYKIRYQLKDMENNQYTRSSYYEGIAAFEEMEGSESDKRKWKKNRLKAYQGSSMHFLRSVISNTFAAEGFKALRIIKKDKSRKGLPPGGGPQPLVSTPLSVGDFAKLTDVEGEYALTFEDYLYILYYPGKPNLSEKDKKKLQEDPYSIGTPLDTTIVFNEQYAFFDGNGIIINPLSVSFGGNWGGRLMAELLPVDYVPE